MGPTHTTCVYGSSHWNMSSLWCSHTSALVWLNSPMLKKTGWPPCSARVIFGLGESQGNFRGMGISILPWKKAMNCQLWSSCSEKPWKRDPLQPPRWTGGHTLLGTRFWSLGIEGLEKGCGAFHQVSLKKVIFQSPGNRDFALNSVVPWKRCHSWG